MLTLITLTACHRDSAQPIATPHGDSQPTSQASSPLPHVPMTPAVTAAPSPPLPEGTDVTYECQDGNQLTVTYTYVTADLHWPDGREVLLSRSASASKNGGDVYVGGKVSLQHDGGSIQFHDGGAAPVTCNESASSA